MNSNTKVEIYTDGGSRFQDKQLGPNTVAAWAYLIRFKGNIYKSSNYSFGKTNNYMEILAVIKALQGAIKFKFNKNKVEVISDSKYIVDAFNKNWINKWVDNGWRRSGHKKIKNVALWKQLVYLTNQFTNLNFVWTKGHSKNEGNNFVDKLLNESMDKGLSLKYDSTDLT